MTAQSHQHAEEFVWFVSRWLVAAMLGPAEKQQLGPKAPDGDEDGGLATRPRRMRVIGTNCTKEVA